MKSGRINWRRIGKLILKIAIWFVLVSFFWVLAYRFINPPITLLMILRNVQSEKEAPPMKKKWVYLKNISPNLQRAALGGEDERFFDHYGFDLKAIERAAKSNAKGKKVKGGSTITQQTAKNVFLWPGRSWVRKGFEAWFTLLIELLWSKERTLEVYLNVIEMGKGIYGAEAASRQYYKTSANNISRQQAALLVACFPNPIRWSPQRPTAYIYRRQALILRKMRSVKILRN